MNEDELDTLATRIAYGVMLAAFAEYGVTRLALARAALAVAVTPAIASPPVLTQEQVTESYAWADTFMRDHMRTAAPDTTGDRR